MTKLQNRQNYKFEKIQNNKKYKITTKIKFNKITKKSPKQQNYEIPKI